MTMKKSAIKIGMRVKAIAAQSDNKAIVGKIGIVRHVSKENRFLSIGVEFRKDYGSLLHDCSGACAPCRGYWFDPQNLGKAPALKK
jgi:hypothetical protein